jgi:hypothetical protein
MRVEGGSAATARRNVFGAGDDNGFPIATGEFVHLSNAALRAEAHALANQMREYGNSYNQKIDEAVKNRRDDSDIQKDAENYYRANFKEKALSLASEILKRAGPIQPPVPHDMQTILQFTGAPIVKHGMVKGAEPFNAAAEFLDYLSGKLPP